MKSMLILGLVLTLIFGPVAAAPSSKISHMTWLVGEWVGEGGAGDEGAAKGVAHLYWTPVAEEPVSSTFSWHAPIDEHVHYAFTVFNKPKVASSGKAFTTAKISSLSNTLPGILKPGF